MPVASHVRTPPPVHCVVPGVHSPVQAPDAQAAFAQGWVLDQVPVTSHVWMPLPEHCFAPGVHTPAQAPLTHPRSSGLMGADVGWTS
jgi:hypothetical protein